ncbi:MAG TPA: histone deacetylase family protein, partial [Desulfuromonadales bacterium]|nr:histone deacetylase family protein [Desulfuromonadales bacterium]
KTAAAVPPDMTRRQRIALVVNEKHEIHHVRERGYVEAPVRVRSILKELEKTDLFHRIAPRRYAERYIAAVHDRDFINYLRRVCRSLPPGKSLYPYVFPIRNSARPPKELAVRAGYFCIDTFTPLNANAWQAARGAVDCALTAADQLLQGTRLAYALVRPPGHHAERRAFGGFCYFNNAAVAAQMLAENGRVAILDIDYHHGNGQQVIFYDRSDVLTVSIHGHPRFAYPYFSGFDNEAGEGEGRGCNLNLPLPEQLTGSQYLEVLERALKKVRRYRPDYLVVCVGLDTAKGDPTGTWSLSADDLSQVGRALGGLQLPTLLVQEGGYRTRSLGVNARHFLTGVWTGAFASGKKA